jgi:hypothetical protein
MARPRPTKKSEPAPPAARVFAMELRTGDRITDETGEWEITAFVVCGRPGKNVHARMKKVDQPDVTEIRTWGAHGRISVKRPTAPP